MRALQDSNFQVRRIANFLLPPIIIPDNNLGFMAELLMGLESPIFGLLLEFVCLFFNVGLSVVFYLTGLFP